MKKSIEMIVIVLVILSVILAGCSSKVEMEPEATEAEGVVVTEATEDILDTQPTDQETEGTAEPFDEGPTQPTGLETEKNLGDEKEETEPTKGEQSTEDVEETTEPETEKETEGGNEGGSPGPGDDWGIGGESF